MKKNYIQPAFEVLTVNATYGLCQVVSQFGNFNYGGDTDTIDPSMGG